MATPTTDMTGSGTSTTDGMTSSTTDGSTSSTTDGTSSSTADGTTSSGVCGDGNVDADEDCDKTSCLADEFQDTFNTCMRGLTCKMSCEFRARECTPCDGCCKNATCGDGVVNTPMDTGVEEECDGEAGCADDCRFERRRVFVTSQAYCGDMAIYDQSNCMGNGGGLTGVERGDARCRELATAANELNPDKQILNPDKMKAWLSTTNADHPAMRFSGATEGFAGRYVMVKKNVDQSFEEILVAYGWAGLIDGLDVPDDKMTGIDINEKGVQLDMVQTVWTNVKADGTSSGSDHCNGWNAVAGDPKPKGGYGYTDVVNAEWTAAGAENCSNAKRLYCFEDP